jgi:hypothetical protein
MNNIVNIEDQPVFDPHYGDVLTSDVRTILNDNDEIVDYVAFDKTNNIVRVTEVKGIDGYNFKFDNTTSYGSLKGDKVEGWAFDRDGLYIDGYESTGYYKDDSDDSDD